MEWDARGARGGGDARGARGGGWEGVLYLNELRNGAIEK